MSYIDHAQLNSLDETSFILGTDFTLKFTIYQDDGVSPLNLTGGTVIWVLAPYGQPSYTVLEKYATLVSPATGYFEVILAASDTENLDAGRHIQQIIIKPFPSGTYRPAQGEILLLASIPTTLS